jgi:hypothetical protein
MVTKKPCANVRALAKLLRLYFVVTDESGKRVPGLENDLALRMAAEFARRGVLAIGPKTVPFLPGLHLATNLRAYLRRLAWPQ